MGLTKKAHMINAHKRNNNVKQTYLFDKHSNNSTKINTQKGGMFGKKGDTIVTKCADKIPYANATDIFDNIKSAKFQAFIKYMYNNSGSKDKHKNLSKWVRGTRSGYNYVSCLIKRLLTTHRQQSDDTTSSSVDEYIYGNDMYNKINSLKKHKIKKMLLIYIYIYYKLYQSRQELVEKGADQKLGDDIVSVINRLRATAKKQKSDKTKTTTSNYKKIENYYDIIDANTATVLTKISTDNDQLTPSLLCVLLHNLIFTKNITNANNQVLSQIIENAKNLALSKIVDASINLTATSGDLEAQIKAAQLSIADHHNKFIIVPIMQNYIVSLIIDAIINSIKECIIEEGSDDFPDDFNKIIINAITKYVCKIAKHSTYIDIKINEDIEETDPQLSDKRGSTTLFKPDESTLPEEKMLTEMYENLYQKNITSQTTLTVSDIPQIKKILSTTNRKLLEFLKKIMTKLRGFESDITTTITADADEAKKEKTELSTLYDTSSGTDIFLGSTTNNLEKLLNSFIKKTVVILTDINKNIDTLFTGLERIDSYDDINKGLITMLKNPTLQKKNTILPSSKFDKYKKELQELVNSVEFYTSVNVLSLFTDIKSKLRVDTTYGGSVYVDAYTNESDDALSRAAISANVNELSVFLRDNDKYLSIDYKSSGILRDNFIKDFVSDNLRNEIVKEFRSIISETQSYALTEDVVNSLSNIFKDTIDSTAFSISVGAIYLVPINLTIEHANLLYYKNIKHKDIKTIDALLTAISAVKTLVNVNT